MLLNGGDAHMLLRRTWEERIKQELKVNYMYVSFAAKNTHTLVQTHLSVSLKQVELIMNCT
jgi:hypothetical protein